MKEWLRTVYCIVLCFLIFAGCFFYEYYESKKYWEEGYSCIVNDEYGIVVDGIILDMEIVVIEALNSDIYKVSKIDDEKKLVYLERN